MEQNEKIEEMLIQKVEVDDVTEESSPQELETEGGELTAESPEKVEINNLGEDKPVNPQDPPTESQSKVKEEELYQKLKTELMEEIRKYFDPILKEGKPVSEVLQQDEKPPVEGEDNLINRIINESGW